MTKLTKKQKALQGKVDSNKLYPLTDAIGIVKEAATAKFDESIDVAVQRLGRRSSRASGKPCRRDQAANVRRARCRMMTRRTLAAAKPSR